MVRDNRILNGTKEIKTYTRRSWPTVKEWIDGRRFPAKKIDGVWTSSITLIDLWLEEQITCGEKTSIGNLST